MRIKPPFQLEELDETKRRDTFTVALNAEERQQLEIDKKLLRQLKDSTAIKQLASIGSKVLHDPKTAELLNILFDNRRKNKRLGLNEF